ncbi:MAG TPA: tetratricopeptide repeat protein [Pirellulales bacterium]|nr:tetratricopeptide repeat protein [Pirellulales bacterium]
MSLPSSRTYEAGPQSVSPARDALPSAAVVAAEHCGVRSAILSSGLLIAVPLAAFWGVWNAGLVNFDDDLYVADNPHVTTGLTTRNVAWALTTTHAGYWQPLTWLSLQLDATLFRGSTAGYHLTNLALHVVNALALMWFVRSVTGRAWAGLLVALLFAVHPLRVESVAWVTERKDVLSSLFGLLALIAYVGYARAPAVPRYLTVAICMLLSLMAKPMLVTLPCLLLVLDAWPLRRTRQTDAATGESVSPWPRLVVEKFPLFALATVFAIVTARAQGGFGAVHSLAHDSLAHRLQTALTGYQFYLEKTVWPVQLAVFYPLSHKTASWREWLVPVVLLAAITAVAVWQRRRWPSLLVGWLWFVGTLVPVIGLVQSGDQAFADRFTYFPLIGLFLALALAVDGLLLRWPRVGAVALAAMCPLVGMLAVQSHQQVAYWHDSEALWRHALAVTEDNHSAHAHLADVLLAEGRADEGVEHAGQALRIFPSYTKHLQFANILLNLQRNDEAIEQYRQALLLKPNEAELHLSLGTLLLADDRVEEARHEFDEAVACRTDWADAWNNLGTAHALLGDSDEALRCYDEALKLNANNAECLNNIGQVLTRKGKYTGALRALDQALKINPHYAEAHSNLGNALILDGRLGEAAVAYRDAIEERPDVARYRFNLASVLEERNETDLARQQYRLAMRLDPAWPETATEEAWKLATDDNEKRRDGAKAVRLARQACGAVETPAPASLDALAAAYAETGDFAHAEATALRAIEAAHSGGDEPLAEQIEKRRALYQAEQPYRCQSE